MRVTISLNLPEGQRPSRALSAALAALALAAPAVIKHGGRK